MSHWCSYHILTSSVIYYWIRRTATWNLFVLYNNEKPLLFQNISTYYMATIVRALWLAAERALFSCNDRALWNFFRLDGSFELWVKLSARERKQQNRWTKYNYIFNNWKKNWHTDTSSLVWAMKKPKHPQADVENSFRCFYCILFKGHIINNLLTSTARSLQGNLRPWPWCIGLAIARSIHQGPGLRFPCNDLTLG